MGGGAFLNAQSDGRPPIRTRRMSPEEYQQLKTLYLGRLQSYLEKDQVTCLIEAPEKVDYGDIDIQVASDELIDWTDVATKIGAVAWLERGSLKHQKCSIAVRINGEHSIEPPPMYMPINHEELKKRKASPVYSKGEYAQIDIEKIPPDLKVWRAFHGSYGDLAGMIGNIVTAYGFTLSDHDFRVRFAEADTCKNDPEWQHLKLPVEEGRIFLSSDPDEVMGFLGLDVERYYAGFETVEEIYEWLSGCRMISDRFLRKEAAETANDRHKEFRAMFKQFFREWLPRRLETKAEATDPATQDVTKPDDTTFERESSQGAEDAADTSNLRSVPRQKYLNEALDHFKAHDVYETTHSAFLLKRNNEQAAYLLRPLLVQLTGKPDKKLTEILRAFRRNVAYVEGQGPVILAGRKTDAESALHTFLDADGRALKDEDPVGQWIGENWERVKTVERERAAKEKVV